MSTRFARSLTFGVKERTRAGYKIIMHLVPNVIFVFQFFCKSLFKTGQLKYEIRFARSVIFPSFFGGVREIHWKRCTMYRCTMYSVT